MARFTTPLRRSEAGPCSTIAMLDLGNPVRHWAISPDGTRLFAACARGNSLLTFDVERNTLLRRDAVRGRPSAVSFAA